ncbi:sigma-70 family RNA polymerase sigma factor [Psychroflexus gondwanensis]|jgi:RNA polymerase sigma-70 factor (ECF subfamily)|uniref:RNA polymerase ECF-type sigma factor,sigma70 superfamily protein n=1 Tax=Psychroflexus gondwanensis ACAM 44 TaxID=1189619 RepID=N1WV24_9FLAO|nr:sigma-70 family RNA polymerase sigma factor [Psychroflexus gondwanensis]EMY80949.1 RNA polymerase ECF-type sigma factor,sigma70 superfamily protein [Psychroflexus gondwanensis ACAM 44]TXE21412.1 sigma-70 family RNA polymerase sigma factor [Psychroflexus gondwanensis]
MEKQLVDNVCEEQVFEGIYSKNSEVINNYFFYKFGNQVMAEESVQEAFIKLWENCKKVPFAKAKSYLYTVANNISLNKYKHQKVVLKYAKTEPQQTEDLQSPEYKMEEKEFKVKLEKAIQDLSEKQRTAFLLHRIDNRSYKEIAEILNISVKAVEKRMQKALEGMRKQIDEFK